MVKVEYLRGILLEEYGISTDKELEDAIRKIQKINIGLFATRVMGNFEFEQEERKGA